MNQKKSQFSNIYVKTVVLNGVYYSEISQNAQIFRIGSINATWQERLALFNSSPGAEEIRELEKQGIFISKNLQAPPLALICSGLGAAWPGMGKSLYDNFPVARDAMEEIASLSEWDVLGLLDETSPEIINSPRYQIPYLLLVEYAQWSILRFLGLQPNLICGHSLGELIALCFAGVYPLEAAWLLLDTRARHMDVLEKNSNSATGMLTVPVDKQRIDEILFNYPDLEISNANTSHQFVLSGSRQELMEIRRSLRRAHIPAFMLPISLAFHNSSMRILRNLSTRRLNALEMHSPQIPMLSCVKAALYPQTQKEICQYIADLDENTVNWIDSVHFMREEFKIDVFLELGPQDILSAITRENAPDSITISANRKDHETETMRKTCAQLFALGYLPFTHLLKLKQSTPEHIPAFNDGSTRPEKKHVSWEGFKNIPLQEIEKILDILAELSHIQKENLMPDMDLKYDLGLRSSNFPLLLQEFEKRTGKEPALENIFKISTVGDLVALLSEQENLPQTVLTKPFKPNSRLFSPPLCIYEWHKESGFRIQRINKAHTGLCHAKEQTIILLGEDDQLINELWESLAPLEYSFIVPDYQLASLALLEKAGSKLTGITTEEKKGIVPFLQKIASMSEIAEKLTGLFFALNMHGVNEEELTIVKSQLQLVATAISLNNFQIWTCIFIKCQFPDPKNLDFEIEQKIEDIFKFICKTFPEKENCHIIIYADAQNGSKFQNRNETGDLFALNMLYKNFRFELWKTCKKNKVLSCYPLCISPNSFFLCSSDLPAPVRSGSFNAECQFSVFSLPSLAQHGKNSKPLSLHIENIDAGTPNSWLPPGMLIAKLIEAGNLALPWLNPASIQDLNLITFAKIPYGITRECRTGVLLRPWLIQSGNYTRLCKIELTLRELAINGRRKNSWLPAADVIAAYNAGADTPESLWEGPTSLMPVPDDHLEKFYKILNFGEDWHFISHPAYSPDASSIQFRCSLSNIENPQALLHDLAPKKEWGYIKCSKYIDAIVQGAFLASALHFSFQDTALEEMLSDYSLKSIGYLKMNWNALFATAQTCLEMRLAWKTSTILNFDAQIFTANEILMQMTRLELEKRAG